MINVSDIARPPKDYDSMVSRKIRDIDYILNGVVVNKNSSTKSPKAYNVDIHLDTPKLLPTSKCRVSCTCHDFQFRWAYVLWKKDALLNPRNYVLEPPKITNPDGILNACKHIHTFMKAEMDKVLRQMSNRKNQI